VVIGTYSTEGTFNEQYPQNFIHWALARQPTPDEANYWEDVFRAAYAHQQGSMIIAVREMARTMFESADYAGRARDNHWYVYDLYKTYLMRDPDAPGWQFWEGQCNSYGRDQVRRAFDECSEFAGDVAAITMNGTATTAVSSILSARVDPNNQTGNQLLARDAEWSMPLLSLPGRAGWTLVWDCLIRRPQFGPAPGLIHISTKITEHSVRDFALAFPPCKRFSLTPRQASTHEY
jgi:hypothetical protein